MLNICKTCSIWWETLQMIIYWFCGFPAWFWCVLAWFWWVPSWLSFFILYHLQKFSCWKSTTHYKIFWDKSRNQAKLDKTTTKKRDLLLLTVWALVPKMYFCSGNWAKDWVPMKFFNFPDISLLCKILSLRSFGRPWAKSYIQFVLLDMKFILHVGNRNCTKILQNSQMLEKNHFVTFVFKDDSKFRK